MIDLIIESRSKDLGGGLQVGRVLPFVQRRMIGPFVFLDHMGPADFKVGEGVDVRPHPHIGLSTVTYLFDGEIHHRDNLGISQKIRPGEVNWMTAGAGIVHSERTDPSLRSTGQLMHGMQAWVAMPAKDEEIAPSFLHYQSDAMNDGMDRGLALRLIAGSAYGMTSGVHTYSPLFFVHAEIAEGAKLAMPTGYAERGAYIVTGTVEHEGKRYESGRMLVFTPGGESAIEAVNGPARVMLLGGDNIGERFVWWNFVSSRQERIEQAKADWIAGRMALPAEDHDEFIPLPQ